MQAGLSVLTSQLSTDLTGSSYRRPCQWQVWKLNSKNSRMNAPQETIPARNSSLLRAHAVMTPSLVPSISTELLASADGELNRELHHFLFDPASNPDLLRGKTIAICCTNGVEE